MPLGKKIAFLGSGNMAEALVKGLLAAGTAAPDEIVCAEPRAERREELHARHGIAVTASNLAAVKQADILVLSVKPQVMDALLDEIAPAVDARKLVVSIAAGVPISAIAHKLGATARIEAVGTAVVVEEHLLDAVTGLSGSGPAFVFLAIEALADGGVKVGLPRHVALALAAQTVVGAGQLVLETGDHPGKLKDQVTSPGGTTIAGVHALEAAGFRAALMAAVEAAAKRSRELGELAAKKS